MNTNYKSNHKILNFRHESDAGFTMIEIIIAISILSFGIVSVFSTFSTITDSINNVSSRFTAAYLAQEGLEIVKNIRDNNFIASRKDSNIIWSAGLLGGPCSLGCMLDYKTKNYTQIILYNDDFLVLDDDGFYSYDSGGLATIFKRKIIVSPVLGFNDAINVSVSVFWNYKGQSFNFEANENLYNWH